MEAELRAHLVNLAGLYCEAKGLELVTVARLATGDWRFFTRLDEGASFTAKKYDSIVRWFLEKWPDDLEWPSAVPIPAKVAESQDAAA